MSCGIHRIIQAKTQRFQRAFCRACTAKCLRCNRRLSTQKETGEPFRGALHVILNVGAASSAEGDDRLQAEFPGARRRRCFRRTGRAPARLTQARSPAVPHRCKKRCSPRSAAFCCCTHSFVQTDKPQSPVHAVFPDALRPSKIVNPPLLRFRDSPSAPSAC